MKSLTEINWDSPASCTSSLGGCFCEQVKTVFMAQPINTISSLFFIVAAIAVLMSSKSASLKYLYALLLVFIGVGSAYYHAELTFLGQTIDFGSMNLLILFAIFYYWFLSNKRTAAFLFIFGYILAVLISFVVLIYIPDIRRAVFGALVLLVIGLYLRDPAKIVPLQAKKWLASGFGIFLIGYIFWNIDTYGLLCDPESWIQGHAIWHATSALAAYCLFRSIALLRPKTSKNSK